MCRLEAIHLLLDLIHLKLIFIGIYLFVRTQFLCKHCYVRTIIMANVTKHKKRNIYILIINAEMIVIITLHNSELSLNFTDIDKEKKLL